MCLFAISPGGAPTAFAIYWIARPGVVEAVFGTFIWPLLGLIFLPFTTLMYTISGPRDRRDGLGLAVDRVCALLDLGHYGYSAYGNRESIPGMTSN